MSEVDVAIVGGGASGIYSAWRLAHATPTEVARVRETIGGEGPLRVRLYEMSDRIGGRLMSASPQRLPDVPMELGGMRYVDHHHLVRGLVKTKFDFATRPQVVDRPQNLAWLRREPFRHADLSAPGTKLPYKLTDEEQAFLTSKDAKGQQRTPADLIFWAVFQEFPELATMPREKIRPWLESEARVDGMPLYKVGFWNLLSRYLSGEARTLAIKAVGYDCLGGNANAVDIIAENLDFTDETVYHLFEDGFETVLWRLEREFRKAGGEICFKRELESFVQPDPDQSRFLLEFWNEGEAKDTARAIVLAMPPAALRNMRKMGPLLNPEEVPEFQSLLNSVTGIPLYKLFVIYDRPWWEEAYPEITEGRSVTDLPLRQCYYWHVSPGKGAAIMAYNDEASVSFWGGYQIGPQGPENTVGAWGGIELFASEGGEADLVEIPVTDVDRRRKNWVDNHAPTEMVMEMHRQLQELHGVTDAPEPVDAAFVDWMNLPFGGAVHFWNPGYKSWEVRDQMVQPVAGVNAFVVGEAWSTYQTWVEGAFQTSEIFLQKIGLDAPTWVTP